MRTAGTIAIIATMSVLGCGGEDATAPEFPRAFTAVTDSCSARLGIYVDSELGHYVETLMFQTVHASTEPLFPRRICFVITRVLSFSGAHVEEDVVAIPCLDEAGELEGPAVSIEAGPEDWHFVGAGTVDGRSIEFVMEPLFAGCDSGNCQCGFATTGTVW